MARVVRKEDEDVRKLKDMGSLRKARFLFDLGWRRVKCKNKGISGCCQGHVANLGSTAGPRETPATEGAHSARTMEEVCLHLPQRIFANNGGDWNPILLRD